MYLRLEHEGTSSFYCSVGVPEDMNFKSFPSIRLRFWQGNALASAEQPPVAAPLGWEAVTLRWDGGMLGCWKMFHLEFAIGPESLESFFFRVS